MRRRVLITLAAAACLVITGCNAKSSSDGAASSAAVGQSASSPIKIGYANVNSGAIEEPGWDHGVDAAVKYVNTQLGGVNGRPIQIVTCNTPIDTTVSSGQACGEQFANDGSIAFAMTGILINGGSFYSALNAVHKPVYGGLPVTQTDYTSKGVNFYLGGGIIAGAGVGAMTKSMVPNVKTVHVLYLDTPAGQDQLTSYKLGLGSGVNVVATPVSDTATDLLGQVEAAAGGSPSAISLLLTLPQCEQAAKAFAIVKPKVPIFTNSECVNPTTASQGSINGWYLANYDEPSSIAAGTNPDMDTYKKLYQKYATTSPIEDFAVEGWSEILTLRSILKAISGPITSASVTTALDNFKGPVVLGPAKVSCPGPAGYPSNCALSTDAFGFVWKNGVAVPTTGGGQFKLSLGS